VVKKADAYRDCQKEALKEGCKSKIIIINREKLLFVK
jgi:predicted DNA-binding antitoxin AbrB/MazE fold protein